MERIVNNIQAYLFLAVGIACAMAVIVKGAYWHIWTSLICYVMFRALYTRKDREGK